MESADIKEALSFEEESVNSHSSCNEISGNIATSEKSDNIYKTRTCSYFNYYGYCKFGNSCKYKHSKRVIPNHKYGSKNEKSSSSQSSRAYKRVDSENKLQNSGKPLKQNCRYFKMGGCKKGENCEFLHSVDDISNEMASLSVTSQSQNVPKKVFSSNARTAKKRATPLCHYFKKGLCYKGDNCKFYHQNKSTFTDRENFSNSGIESNSHKSLLSSKHVTPAAENSSTKKSIIETSSTKKPIIIFNRALNVYDLSSLTTDVIAQLRSTEINQLKKRFPHFEVITENQTFSVLFEPSDPDWAFDVNKLILEVNFPVNYPSEKCKITVLQSTEYMPLLLIKHLNKAIFDWIDQKFEENGANNKTELIFRPFLKWFDKNLEDLFIIGLRKVKQDLKAKEDGIEFVPVENLFASPQENSTEREFSSSIENDAAKCDKEDTVNSTQFQEQNFVSNNKNSQTVQDNKPSYYSSNNAMKVNFSELEFIEGAAAFICTKISVTLQCSRCRTSFNMKSVSKKSNSHICSKCSKSTGFTFEPSTIHPFSSVLGTLHLLDCVAVDINLVECHFLVDCLKCSKQVPIDGIHYGQKHKMWCSFCSEKMLISVGSVKFQALKLASVPVTKYPTAKKIEKKIKDPVIKEGEPLPNFGACKHYKKSFRWLRFPCCGRLYPCDECHNEKETDHEMKYASRMICGFCAKEQPYSREKPCTLCAQSMTKKSGSHWEGGKGCRNKIQMSREDKQKYSGVSKTVSRKAQMNKPKKKH